METLDRSPHIHLFFLNVLLLHLSNHASSVTNQFVFNDFAKSNLTLTDSAVITDHGALRLTNNSNANPKGYSGHAFYSDPLQFKTSPSAGTTLSFSTHFIFAIVQQSNPCCGFAFTIAPSSKLTNVESGNYLGLFNKASNNQSSRHIFAVEFDTAQGTSVNDMDDNHVGVDINSVISKANESAAYYTNDGPSQPIDLKSGDRIKAWIDYEAKTGLLNITIAPITFPSKPSRSLISYSDNLSSVLQEFMYVGFSGGTKGQASEHYVLGWSFAINAQAPDLDLKKLPPYPKYKPGSGAPKFLPYLSTVALFLFTVLVISSYFMYRRWKLSAETVEDWELQYPHRFPYKQLYRATKGFNEKGLLGKGGFGSVYKGVLPSSGMEIAVKRLSGGAKHGMREFIAEISSLGMLRHRNLVQLQGWCRRGEDLLLVYDFMPNGSLDKFLFGDHKRVLSWEERFKILQGIASGLLYLHEGWEQMVVHRDIKAGNVLLDAEMNGKLSDFGLARLYEHGTNPQTTHVVGTLGYMAPELTRIGKPTVSSDVFSFGRLLLEVACGRSPMDWKRPSEEVLLAEWVFRCWKNGRLLHAVDEKLGMRYVEEEADLVLKLGILCSQSAPDARPTMRQVVQFLNGDVSIDEFTVDSLIIEDNGLGFDQLALHYPPSGYNSFTSTSIR